MSEDLVSNRKAFHDYEILETFEAGIVLKGTEVKSLRNHGGSLQESYILIRGNRAILKNSYIALYKFGNLHNHEERTERILLLHKRELEKLKKATEQKGLTLIPLSMYIARGKIKLKIAIAKGRKNYDKRALLKTKEHQRQIQREGKAGFS